MTRVPPLIPWLSAFAPALLGLVSAAAAADPPAGLRFRLEGAGTAPTTGHGFAFSPDARRLAAPEHGGLRIWSLDDGKPGVALRDGPAAQTAVAWSRTGVIAASGGEGGLWLWDGASGRRLRKIDVPAEAYAVAFSADSAVVGVCCTDRTTRLFEAATGRPVARHDWAYGQIAFDPAGTAYATADGEGTIRVFAAPGGREIRSFFGHEGGTTGLAFCPAGRRLVSCGNDGRLRLWNLAAGRQIRECEGHAGAVAEVAFSPDGRTVVSGGVDSTLRVWEAATGRELLRRKGHVGIVNTVAFSPDGRLAAGKSDQQGTLVWRALPDAPVPAPAPDRAWEDLGAADPAVAWRAAAALSADPAPTLDRLRTRVSALPERRPRDAAEAVGRLLIRLDDEDFNVREAASAELAGLGPEAEPHLRRALAEGRPSAEVRLRLEAALAALADDVAPEPGEPLRLHRTAMVLERIGSPEALRLLRLLAERAPDARLRAEAAGSVRRIAAAGRRDAR